MAGAAHTDHRLLDLGALISSEPFQPFGGLTLIQIVVGLDERGRRAGKDVPPPGQG